MGHVFKNGFVVTEKDRSSILVSVAYVLCVISGRGKTSAKETKMVRTTYRIDTETAKIIRAAKSKGVTLGELIDVNTFDMMELVEPVIRRTHVVKHRTQNKTKRMGHGNGSKAFKGMVFAGWERLMNRIAHNVQIGAEIETLEQKIQMLKDQLWE